jgi:hypothetical protein
MAEKRTIELEIQDNSKSLKAQYREAVAELQKISAAYGETSEQAVKAAKAAAELKDQIEFSNDLIKGFNPDAKFAAAEGAINGVMNGIQAFEGGLALIGVESDKVQEAMLRVQAVMALTQGINGVMQAKDAFLQLGTVAKAALKGIKTEIIATGIGVFVVALGTIVAYWDEISEAVSGVSKEQKALNKLTIKNQEISNKTLEDYENQNYVLKLQGKTDKEILKGKIALQERVVKDNMDNLKNIQTTVNAEIAASKIKEKNLFFLGELYRSVVNMALDLVSKPLDLLIDQANSVADKLGFDKLIKFDSSSLKKDVNATFDYFKGISKGFYETIGILADETELNKQISAANSLLKKSQNELAQSKLELRDMDIKTGKESVNNERENAQEKIDLERENIDKRIALMADGYDKEVALAKEKNKREKEDLIASSKDKIVDAQQLADAEKLIDETLKKELRQLELKYNSDKALTWEEKNKLEIQQKKKEIDDELLAAGERIKIREAEAEKKKKIDEEELQRRNELRQKTLELAGNTFSALADLAGSFNTKNEKDARKQFQIQKAFNLGAAITNTAMAVTGALTAGGNPIKLATGQQFVEAAIAATIGAANIIKIANSKFGGGGSSSSGGGGGSNAPASSPMTANFNTIGSSGINQLAQLQQTPTQAYVVSGEVTSAQALDRNRVQNATL